MNAQKLFGLAIAALVVFVSVIGQSGYVNSPMTPEKTPAPVQERDSGEVFVPSDGGAWQGVVCTETILRGGPGEEYRSWGTVSTGTTVEIREQVGAWYRTRQNLYVAVKAVCRQ